MRLSHLLSLSLLLAAGQRASAQTASDFFNSGAQSYISNNIAGAKEKVEGGLKLYPDDMKLKKLEELLKQQSQSQSQDKQQSQSQDSQSQQNQNSQSQNQDQQKSDQQKQQDQQQQDQSQARKEVEKQKQSEKQDQSQEEQSASESKDKADEDARREAAMMAAGQMTPQQAAQLLDAQKEDEQVLRIAPTNNNTARSGSFKNW